MATKKYLYNRESHVLKSISVSDSNVLGQTVTYDYENDSIFKSTIDGSIKYSFDRDLNDVETKIINKPFVYFVEPCDGTSNTGSDVDTFVHDKRTEYNSNTNIMYNYEIDRKEVIKTFPISIIKEIGLDYLTMDSTQYKILEVTYPDNVLTYNYVDGKISSIVFKTLGEINWKVKYDYYTGTDKISRITEYSVSGEVYTIEGVFTILYSDSTVIKINVTNQPYNEININYNGIGKMISADKITNNTYNLWFTFDNSVINFFDNSYSFTEEYADHTFIVSDNIDSETTVDVDYVYDNTKPDVYGFFIPYLLNKDYTYINLNPQYIMFDKKHSYIESMNYFNNGIGLYTLVPEYIDYHIKRIDIFEFGTTNSLGLITYNYKNDLIQSIEVILKDEFGSFNRFNEFVYIRDSNNVVTEVRYKYPEYNSSEYSTYQISYTGDYITSVYSKQELRYLISYNNLARAYNITRGTLDTIPKPSILDFIIYNYTFNNET